MKNILVTAADGFVGTNVLEQIHGAIAMDRRQHDFFNLDTLKPVLENVDVIIHLAGVNAGTSSIPSKDSLIKNNLETIEQLLKGIKLYSQKRPRIIFLSSLHVYSPEEKSLSEASLIAPKDDYGIMKYAQELLLRQAATLGLIELVVFRATHIYGPYSKPYYNSAVATMCSKAIAEAPLELYANGQVMLDLIYVADVVNYIKKAMEIPLPNDHDTFNLATGSQVTVGEIADHIENNLDVKLARKLIDSPVKNRSVNITKLTKHFGPILLTKLNEGIRFQLQALLAAAQPEPKERMIHDSITHAYHAPSEQPNLKISA